MDYPLSNAIALLSDLETWLEKPYDHDDATDEREPTVVDLPESDVLWLQVRVEKEDGNLKILVPTCCYGDPDHDLDNKFRFSTKWTSAVVNDALKRAKLTPCFTIQDDHRSHNEVTSRDPLTAGHYNDEGQITSCAPEDVIEDGELVDGEELTEMHAQRIVIDPADREKLLTAVRSLRQGLEEKQRDQDANDKPWANRTAATKSDTSRGGHGA